jgi:hypothetical protein
MRRFVARSFGISPDGAVKLYRLVQSSEALLRILARLLWRIRAIMGKHAEIDSPGTGLVDLSTNTVNYPSVFAIDLSFQFIKSLYWHYYSLQ